ncbi:hypothetical protein LDENG_00095980, partial [Lucifuga dentata]
TYKAFHSQAPADICELLTPYSTRRCLRSSGSNLLTIANLKTKGDRAFTLTAPKLWNDLPEDLRLAKSASALNQLKTHFYRLAFM